MSATTMTRRAAPRRAARPARPPDGGWGWVVVLGVSVTYMTNMALFSVFSLMFGLQLEAWGLQTTGVAFISSTMTSVQNFSGLLVGPLVRRVGSKTVSLIGAALTSTGMALSFFARDAWHVLITWSFLVGMGVGLVVPSTFLGISSWFSARRSQAVGITLAGTGLGQMLLPHLVRLLTHQYGPHGCWLVVAGIALHSIPGCLLYRKPVLVRDLEEPTESQPLTHQDKEPSKSSQDSAKAASAPASAQMDDLSCESSAPRPRLGPLRRVVQAMDMDLLCNLRFINLALGTGLVYTTMTSFSMIFPFFLMAGVGLSVADTALCMSVQSGADLVSRLVLPQLMSGAGCSRGAGRARRGGLAARTVMLIGALGSAASRSAMAELSDRTALLAMSAVTGLFRGATVLNQNLVIAEHVAPAKLPGAIGMANVIKGACVLGIGSALGVVRDVTQSFALFIHCLTLLALLTAASWLLESLLCPLPRKAPR